MKYVSLLQLLMCAKFQENRAARIRSQINYKAQERDGLTDKELLNKSM